MRQKIINIYYHTFTKKSSNLHKNAFPRFAKDLPEFSNRLSFPSSILQPSVLLNSFGKFYLLRFMIFDQKSLLFWLFWPIFLSFWAKNIQRVRIVYLFHFWKILPFPKIAYFFVQNTQFVNDFFYTLKNKIFFCNFVRFFLFSSYFSHFFIKKPQNLYFYTFLLFFSIIENKLFCEQYFPSKATLLGFGYVKRFWSKKKARNQNKNAVLRHFQHKKVNKALRFYIIHLFNTIPCPQELSV